MKKRPFFLLLTISLAVVFLAGILSAEKIGPNLVRDLNALSAAPTVSGPAKAAIFSYLGREIERGRFVLLRSRTDADGKMEHRRFGQRYEGLPVWGGEILQHLRDGKVESYEGEFYRIAGVDLNPKRTPDEALAACRTGLRHPDLVAKPGATELIIFPVNDQDFRLAYKMTVERPDALFIQRVVVDAATGEILFRHSLIQTEDLVIGSGAGVRSNTLKFPTTLQNGKYYLWDQAKVRPVTQRTFDAGHQYGGTIYISSSNDNTWAKNSIVNAHTYIGLVYDYYFIVFGSKGIDGNNAFVLNSFVHVYDPNRDLADNAFFLGENSMYGPGFYFLDPYSGSHDYAGTLDVVGHEYSHGVTTFTGADLTYYGEPGALNESFSDIFGTAIEFYFQPEGTGFDMADWFHGEDGGPTFTYAGCRRDDDPNLNSQLANAGAPASLRYPDPCHISQKVPTLYQSDGSVFDEDGVHLNCTIFPHLFYLLAHGGTNRVSHLAVTGIGLEKAEKIMWRAFIEHMTSSTNFLGAANAILLSAIELYGSTSAEVAQTKNAIRAIGYTVN